MHPKKRVNGGSAKAAFCLRQRGDCRRLAGEAAAIKWLVGKMGKMKKDRPQNKPSIIC